MLVFGLQTVANKVETAVGIHNAKTGTDFCYNNKRWAQKKQGFGRMGEISSSKRKMCIRDRAWNEYKKGLIDFVIAVVAGVTYLNFNGTSVNFLSNDC